MIGCQWLDGKKLRGWCVEDEKGKEVLDLNEEGSDGVYVELMLAAVFDGYSPVVKKSGVFAILEYVCLRCSSGVSDIKLVEPAT